jgi:cell cycle checkpoint protein
MSTIGELDHGVPIFKAVSSSARQLFQLLNCIRFAPKAQVQISNEGLRFAVEESRVMQGMFAGQTSYGSNSNVLRDCLSR